MTAMMPAATNSNRELLDRAVYRSAPLTAEGLLERAFTFAFRGLVYAQIWEDPDLDMEALAFTPESRVVSIASGGCNLLSYLMGNPAHISGVDLNAAHLALNRMKLTAVGHAPDYETFYRLLGQADQPGNARLFDRFVSPHLDAESRAYWNSRDRFGRRRIAAFERGFYRTGLLGRFIAMSHLIARRYGVDPKSLATATSRADMQARFEAEIAPLFDKPAVRILLDNPMSLYGLGIPPAQYAELATDGPRMAAVVRERLRKLLCDFDLDDNYFAWQALTRGYKPDGSGPLPPYLQRANFETLRERIDRLDVQQISMTDFLARQEPHSTDRYVLLDAQDWMSPAQLDALWREITRTARPGARVIFRTAGAPSILPGRLSDDLLRQWTYHERQSMALFARDRSAIYGGFHLYEKAI